MRWAAYAAEYRADDVTIMTTQVPRLNFEERVQRTDGTQGWVRTSKLPIFNATGDVIGVLGVSEDITERRALEMRVQQTQKLEVLGRLAGSIAHDFNNVLMVIRGCAALAAIQLPDLHPARTEVRAIEQASDHATSLIHQLLTFARQQVFTPQRLALPEVIRRMEGLLQRLLGATIQIAIDLSQMCGPCMVMPASWNKC